MGFNSGFKGLNILDFYSTLAPNFIFLDVINIIYYHCTYSVSFVVQNANRKKEKALLSITVFIDCNHDKTSN